MNRLMDASNSIHGRNIKNRGCPSIREKPEETLLTDHEVSGVRRVTLIWGFANTVVVVMGFCTHIVKNLSDPNDLPEEFRKRSHFFAAASSSDSDERRFRNHSTQRLRPRLQDLLARDARFETIRRPSSFAVTSTKHRFPGRYYSPIVGGPHLPPRRRPSPPISCGHLIPKTRTTSYAAPGHAAFRGRALRSLLNRWMAAIASGHRLETS